MTDATSTPNTGDDVPVGRGHAPTPPAERSAKSEPRPYVILQATAADDGETFRKVGTVDALSVEAALNAAVEKFAAVRATVEGEDGASLVAVTARSWKPRTVKIAVKSSVSIG